MPKKKKKNQNIAKSFKWSLYPSCGGLVDGLWKFGEEVEESLHCCRTSNPPLSPVKSITLAAISKDASSYPPIEPTNFDLIILGTGLPKSVIAVVVASTNDKIVLHTMGVIDEVLREKGEREKGKKEKKEKKERKERFGVWRK